MDDLYRDYILDHYKHPRNFGELEPHDLEALEHNPLCGDELGVHIRVQDDRIADLRFHGHGCAISQAAASISSEELKGMPLSEVGGQLSRREQMPRSRGRAPSGHEGSSHRAERLMDDLYRDYILDHYKRPRNFGELEPHDLEALEHNPLCGDELGVHIRVKDERIEDLRFHGHGCAISQASASIASEELKGMALEEVARLGADWMIELLGIPFSATRRKCALLNLKVVRGAVTATTRWPA